MCGIAGFIGEGSEHILEKMTRALSHRGPDDEGYAFFPFPAAGSFARAAALGHRRLSIIDLAGGKQPMTNEDGSVHIIFNGEIYNYKAIRARLEKNHVFATHSDTEAIVHLYEEKGADCVKDLEGMFAFAIWDAKKESLLLARDRFGEKPLYYTQTPNVFVFGSELKALLQHPHTTREISRDAVEKYFLFESIPAPHTIFNNIYKLEAGCTLVLEQGKYEVHRYWNIAEETRATREKYVSISERDAMRLVDEKLEKSVEKMLVSDVPLGVFLSGGIDSSTVAYFAGKHATQKIQTFSIAFAGDASFNESSYAAHVAKRIGADHHCETVEAKDVLASIPHIYEMLDEPMADVSLIPTYMLSKYTRTNVTVALGGDGADELFMGYPTFQAAHLAEIYERIPQAIREKVVRPLVNKLPTSFGYLSTDFRLKKFVNDFNADSPEVRNQLWLSAFSPNEMKRLFSNHTVMDALFSDISMHGALFTDEDVYTRLSYLYITHYLQDMILTKVDRASMYNSLEVRAPFLDPDLASTVFALPSHLKLKGFHTKHILKKLMARRLGRSITHRKKQGFQPPIARWLQNDLKPLVREHLDESRIRADGLFDPAYVTRLIQEHEKGIHDHRKKLWALLVFHMWRSYYTIR